MNKERQIIYLGSLLHDIGKLVFRSQALKAGKGHEVLGEQFIREYLGKIDLLKHDIEKIVSESKHHKTSGYCGVADRIASQERTDDTSKLTRRPLLSVINNLSLEPEYKQPRGVYYYPPNADFIDNIFPVNDSQSASYENWKYDEELSISQHHELFKELTKEILLLKHLRSYESISFTLFELLKKYLSKVCSAGYLSKPDISLFDHSRAIGGLVNCLTAGISQDELLKYDPGSIETKFVFLKGDIGGIQKFIYSNINLSQVGSTRNISKKLRGRSFYISLLTQLTASVFLEKFKLAESNLLYLGGGHFNIVLPFKPNIYEEISALEKRINDFLLRNTGTSLVFVTGITECNNSLYTDANKFISEANFILNNNKLSLHNSYLEEIMHNDLQIEQNAFNDDLKLGKLLPYADYLVELKSNHKVDFSNDENLVASFDDFNTYYFMLKKSEVSDYERYYMFLKDRLKKFDTCKIIRINNSDFLNLSLKLSNDIDKPISFGYRYYGNYTPTDQNGILEFEKIAQMDAVSTESDLLSYPKLAVMRLDVDNLGSLFEFGLGEHVSFSRIATMSREFDWFFSGYFNVLAKKYDIYITYSGGDDAFLVGSWLNIMHFAKELYERFEDFTCKNPDITFSAGIYMCDEHFPVAKFAEKAAELEEKSKNFVNSEGLKKNAVSIFDHTLNWRNYCAMIEFAEKLLRYTNQNENIKDKEKLNRSLVHRLLRIIKSSLKSNGEVNIEKLFNNLATLHYLFARHGFDNEMIENAKSGLAKDIIAVFLNVFSKKDIIKDYVIPTHYVVLKTRKK